jgi:exonuclease III
MAHKAETSKIITWNANGILGKKDELERFLKIHNVDVITVCETKLLKSTNYK